MTTLAYSQLDRCANISVEGTKFSPGAENLWCQGWLSPAELDATPAGQATRRPTSRACDSDMIRSVSIPSATASVVNATAAETKVISVRNSLKVSVLDFSMGR